MSHPYAIILAAGGSSRMGQCKALLPVDGVPLVMRHVQSLCELQTVVVVGHEAHRVRQCVGAVPCVHNRAWATTFPSDSVRVALDAMPDATGVLVSPVDVPPVHSGVLSRLVGLPNSAVPVGDDGREGHPVWVTGPRLARLRSGPIDGGLRALLASAQRVVVPGRLGADFDDRAAFDAFIRNR